MTLWEDLAIRDPASASASGHPPSPSKASGDALVILIDQAVVSATSFLTFVIIARAVSKGELGLYTLGFSLVIFITNLQDAIVLAPYTVYSPRFQAERHLRYTGSSLLHQLSVAFSAALLLATAGTIFSLSRHLSQWAAITWALAVAIVFILLREYGRRVCFAWRREKIALALDTCIAVSQIGGLLLLARRGVLSAETAYWVIGATSGAIAVAWLWWSRRRFSFSYRYARLHLFRNLALGKWILASNVAQTISGEIFPWFLAAFRGMTATGTLAACRSLASVTNPFLLGMGNFLGPKTAHVFWHRGQRELNALVVRYTFLIIVPMGIATIVLVLFGDLLLVTLYGAQYKGYGGTVALLAVNQFILILGSPTIGALLAVEHPEALFKSYLASGAVTFLVGLPLVWAYGVRGAAVAMIWSTVTGVAFRGWSLWTFSRVRS